MSSRNIGGIYNIINYFIELKSKLKKESHPWSCFYQGYSDVLFALMNEKAIVVLSVALSIQTAVRFRFEKSRSEESLIFLAESRSCRRRQVGASW